jgi:adenylate cyclase
VAAGARRLAAIMFTDMVGYSALAQADEGTTLGVLDRHYRLLRPIFPRFSGREVKTVGDAFLVEFDSALDAARCALEIQRTLHEYNASAPTEWHIRIRIGLHVGDVVQANGDVLGDAVNIASRIEPLAEPEGICVTQQVYDQVQNKIDVPMVRLPPTELKHIHTPVTVYKLVQPWDTARPAVPSSEPMGGGRHLAVLPLANISPDPQDEYFADGLTEELISVLSQLQDLSVIARTSVIPYKTSPKSIAQVGAELRVDTVLEGSVRKAGNRLRVTLQLVDVASQGHLWANTYNREIGDVFAVQSDIAEQTARALSLRLAQGVDRERGKRPSANPAAYEAYLRGLVASKRPGHGGYEEALVAFAEATRLDPEFAEAYAAWADLHVGVAGDSVPFRQVMPQARELASKALALNPNSSEAHASLGNIAFQFDQDWALAEAELRRATYLNPSNVTAHRYFGFMLSSQGRWEEAKLELRRAMRLDPNGNFRMLLAFTELQSGDADEAIRLAREELAADPDSTGDRIYAGLLYVAAGRRGDAEAIAAAPLPSTSDVDRFDHALLEALLGRPGPAREVAAEIERGQAKSYTSATHLALLLGTLGETTRVLDLLEQDYRDGERILWLYYRMPFFDRVRHEPRFVTLLQKYGLPVPAEGPGAAV